MDMYSLALEMYICDSFLTFLLKITIYLSTQCLFSSVVRFPDFYLNYIASTFISVLSFISKYATMNTSFNSNHLSPFPNFLMEFSVVQKVRANSKIYMSDSCGLRNILSSGDHYDVLIVID